MWTGRNNILDGVGTLAAVRAVTDKLGARSRCLVVGVVMTDAERAANGEAASAIRTLNGLFQEVYGARFVDTDAAGVAASGTTPDGLHPGDYRPIALAVVARRAALNWL